MIKINFLIVVLMLPSFVSAEVDCETRPDHPKCLSDEGGGRKVKAVPLAQTGQTISYELGDDGDLEIGVPWPEPRFADNSDGTLTDRLTGFGWTKDASPYFIWWSDAIDYCNTNTTGGMDDWRLPNIKELLSIIDFGETAPYLPAGHFFTNVFAQIGEFYWSSTTRLLPSTSAYVMAVSFGDLRINNNHQKTSGGHTLCVRGGW